MFKVPMLRLEYSDYNLMTSGGLGDYYRNLIDYIDAYENVSNFKSLNYKI